MLGVCVRDLRHLKEMICDAHYDLQVEDFLVCQIDAQKDLITVSHMQEIDVIANGSVCKVVLMMSHQASRRQKQNEPDAQKMQWTLSSEADHDKFN